MRRDTGKRDGAWNRNRGFLVEEVDRHVSGGNKDIFLNALGWAAEQENGVTIRAKEINVDYLTMWNYAVGIARRGHLRHQVRCGDGI